MDELASSRLGAQCLLCMQQPNARSNSIKSRDHPSAMRVALVQHERLLRHVLATFSRPFHTFRRDSDHDPPSNRSGVTRYAASPTLRKGRRSRITGKLSNDDVNRELRVWSTSDLVTEDVSTRIPLFTRKISTTSLAASCVLGNHARSVFRGDVSPQKRYRCVVALSTRHGPTLVDPDGLKGSFFLRKVSTRR